MPLLPLLLVYGLRLCLAGAAAPPPADPAALIRTLSDPAWSPPAFPNALKRVRAHMAQFRSYVARHVRRFDEGSVSGDPWQTEFYARVGWHFPAPAGRGPVVCETGFNMGMSTVLWLTACDNCTVHSFDLCDRAGGQVGLCLNFSFFSTQKRVSPPWNPSPDQSDHRGKNGNLQQ